MTNLNNLNATIMDLTDTAYNRALSFDGNIMLLQIGNFGSMRTCKIFYESKEELDKFESHVNSYLNLK